MRLKPSAASRDGGQQTTGCLLQGKWAKPSRLIKPRTSRDRGPVFCPSDCRFAWRGAIVLSTTDNYGCVFKHNASQHQRHLAREVTRPDLLTIRLAVFKSTQSCRLYSFSRAFDRDHVRLNDRRSSTYRRGHQRVSARFQAVPFGQQLDGRTVGREPPCRFQSLGRRRRRHCRPSGFAGQAAHVTA